MCSFLCLCGRHITAAASEYQAHGCSKLKSVIIKDSHFGACMIRNVDQIIEWQLKLCIVESVVGLKWGLAYGIPVVLNLLPLKTVHLAELPWWSNVSFGCWWCA